MSVRNLLKVRSLPADAPDQEVWLEQRGLGEWLGHERSSPQVTLYASAFDHGSAIVHTLLVPRTQIDLRQQHAFSNWSGGPFDHPSCGLVWGGGRPPRVELTQTRSAGESWPGAQRLIYGRAFEPLHGNKPYFELAHELTLPHGLHWVEERDAWCRLNDEGDVADLVRVERVGPGGLTRGSGVSITVEKELLDLHMAATDTCLVQMFDSTCTAPQFSGWQTWDDTVFANQAIGLVVKYRVDAPHGSFFRGAQVIRPHLNAEQLGVLLYAKDHAPREYATFVTQDFRNRRLADVSCDPWALASYFDQGSQLPLQTSPVFFNAAVLDKYKSDPDKYQISDRSISCRNAWFLKTFDVNAAGQVHTYITYLGDLPYSEQMYWKSFNEAPKASISSRAAKTDFQGEFDDEPDGLRDLVTTLERLHDASTQWFHLREPALLGQLHYPLTPSAKAWGDVLTTMAKCVIESIDKGWIVAEAKTRGSTGETAWGSLKWLRQLLVAFDVDADRISEIVDPLVELQLLRTKLDAHAGGGEAAKIRRDLLKLHRTPRGHVETLATRLGGSMAAIDALLRPN